MATQPFTTRAEQTNQNATITEEDTEDHYDVFTGELKVFVFKFSLKTFKF